MGSKPNNSAARADAQKKRTALNKIKAIKKAILLAGGNHAQLLEERLKYWEAGGKR